MNRARRRGPRGVQTIDRSYVFRAPRRSRQASVWRRCRESWWGCGATTGAWSRVVGARLRCSAVHAHAYPMIPFSSKTAGLVVWWCIRDFGLDFQAIWTLICARVDPWSTWGWTTLRFVLTRPDGYAGALVDDCVEGSHRRGALVVGMGVGGGYGHRRLYNRYHLINITIVIQKPIIWLKFVQISTLYIGNYSLPSLFCQSFHNKTQLVISKRIQALRLSLSIDICRIWVTCISKEDTLKRIKFVTSCLASTLWWSRRSLIPNLALVK